MYAFVERLMKRQLPIEAPSGQGMGPLEHALTALDSGYGPGTSRPCGRYGIGTMIKIMQRPIYGIRLMIQ